MKGAGEGEESGSHLLGGIREVWGLGEMPAGGTNAEVQKGQAKRPGEGRRKETRGEARSAELPRARRRERHTAAGGTASGSREVAGAIA